MTVEQVVKQHTKEIRDNLTYSISGNVVTCYANNAEREIWAAVNETAVLNIKAASEEIAVKFGIAQFEADRIDSWAAPIAAILRKHFDGVKGGVK